jgi:hypothetical protein
MVTISFRRAAAMEHPADELNTTTLCVGRLRYVDTPETTRPVIRGVDTSAAE